MWKCLPHPLSLQVAHTPWLWPQYTHSCTRGVSGARRRRGAQRGGTLWKRLGGMQK